MNIKEYKLSAETKEEIIEFLIDNLDLNWDGISTPISFKNGTFVYVGQIADMQAYQDEIDPITNEILTYKPGYHFDLQITDNTVIDIPDYVIEHNPTNPKHLFS